MLFALLSALAEEGRFQRVRLAVNRDQAAAVALYASLGFTPCGETIARMGDGEYHLELLLERKL